MTAPVKSDDRNRIDWLLTTAVVAVAVTFVRVIFFTPIERLQGPAQKIFYLHAPSAFIALYVAFSLVAITGVLYLWLRDEKLDRLAASAVEVGVVFMAVTLITGPLWGKPIWGTFWTWDARLTLTLFTWFLFLGYLILRGAIEDVAMRARYSAVLGILGACLVPFIHLSVYLFRTLHPMPIILKPSRPSLPFSMLFTFGLSFVSFSLLFVALLRARYRLAERVDALDAVDAQHVEADRVQSPVTSVRAQALR